MLIPKLASYNNARSLGSYISSLSSLLMNFASPAVVEAPSVVQPDPLPASRPTFDLNKIVIEPAHMNVADEIHSFLHRHHFKNNPAIAHLARPLDRNFLDSLAERYSTTGDRWVAYQLEPKMRKRTIVGAIAGYRKYSWEAAKLQQWAHQNPNPERYYAYFLAHCYRMANLFNKYKIPYIYDIELVAISGPVKGLGIEDMLLRTALVNALERNYYPLVQVLSTDRHTSTACTDAGLVLEWSSLLSKMCDENGMCMFNSVDPLYKEMATADIFIRLISPKRRPICI